MKDLLKPRLIDGIMTNSVILCRGCFGGREGSGLIPGCLHRKQGFGVLFCN